MSDLYSRYLKLCEQFGMLSGISFELTNFCNFSCTHCYRVHGKSFLSPDLFYKALTEAENLGAIMVGFNGGEPTLHPQFLEFAQSVLCRGMHLTVLTNGSGLTNEVVDTLMPWRKGIHFQLSIYGTNPESGYKITGVPNAFQVSLDCGLKLQHLGFDLQVALLVLASTASDIRTFIAYLRSEEINYGLMPQLSIIENGDKSPHSLAASDDQLIGLLPFKSAFLADSAEPIVFPISNSSSTIACGAGITTFGIRVDGRILPCQVFSDPVLGNIATDSLNFALHCDARKQFLFDNGIPENCLSCALFSNCTRCPADALAETGSLTGIPSESCRIAKLRAKFHIDSSK